MNQVTTIPHINTVTPMLSWTPAQLHTMKQTVARDTNDSEFNLFIEYARAKHLDPFSRQVIAVVFNKDKPDKRQMTIIVTQDGQRVLASRCGDYRPEENEAEYVYDDKLKGPTNPLGIVKCTVKLWKQDSKTTQWHPVNGTAYWEEFAPLREIWAETESGKRKPTGKFELDKSGMWHKMPRNQIVKCARMQALRGGWPETFSGVNGEEELDRAIVAEKTASELVAYEAEERRAHAISMAKNEFPWVDGTGALAFLEAGQYADRVLEEARKQPNKAALQSMLIRNRDGMARFWVSHKSDALDLKAALERIDHNLSGTQGVAS